MTKTNRDCQIELLDDFLMGELEQSQVEVLESHLDSCASCRKTLESVTGGQKFWSSLTNALQNDAMDNKWAVETCESNPSLSKRATQLEQADESGTNSVLASIQHLFFPTDDLNSLGRIGTFEILGLIGSGGMGIVLKAREPALDRIVAIKILAPHLATRADANERFSQEARAVAAVKHEGIIAIHSVARHREIPYFVMPYEAGPSLQERVRQQGRLTVEEAIRVAAQVASALAAAHESGLVHRDIKPSNILLAPGTERALLTDFGLAQISDQVAITKTGVVTGTPQFMSPEQARGERVSCASDLFSLGSVIFYSLTGQPPVNEASSYAVIRQIGEQPMPQIGAVVDDVPEWLNTIVKKLHAMNPLERLGSTQKVAHLLNACVAHLQDPAQHELPAELRVQDRAAIIKYVAAPVIALTVLAVTVAIAFQFFLESDQGLDQINVSPHPGAVVENLSAPAPTNEPNDTDILEEIPRATGFDDVDPTIFEWDDGLSSRVNGVRKKLVEINTDQDSKF